MTGSSNYEPVQIFIGVDVGKDALHAVAVNRSDNRLFDTELSNDETRLRSLKSDLKQHVQRLLVVDQPATIGALPVNVARSEGVLVGYLPGLAMRHTADLPTVKSGQMLVTLPSSPDSPCSATSMMILPHKQRSPTRVSAVC
ncbi:Transposase [Cedecea sp. NFIX57]|nr:Transposase [Cedecea sp. NFIX57]